MPVQTIPQQVNDPFTKLDPGNYLVCIEEIKEEYTQDDQRLFYTGRFRIQQPQSHNGQVHYERFYIGTDEDPQGNSPDTWTQKAGRLKKCAEGACVPFTGQNPAVVFQQMLGKQLCMKINHRPYTDNDGKPQTAANVQAWGQAGTMTPEVIGVEGNNGQAQAYAAAPAPVPAAPVPAPGVGSPVPPPAAPQGGGAPVNPPLPPQYQ